MKRVSFLIAFFSITLSAISQVEGSSAYLGMTIPNKSHAAGFILGYKYQYDLPVDGLGFVGTVDFQYCRPKKKVRAQIDEGYENWLEVNNYDEGDVKTKRRESATFVVPFNFGVNYSYSFGRISSWAETGIGFAPIFSTRQVWKADKNVSSSYQSSISGRPILQVNRGERHYYQISKYKPALAFSWRIALGAILDDKYSIGLIIDGLSKYKLKVVVAEDVKPYWNSEKGAYTRENDTEVSTKGGASVSLRFGYHF